MVGSVLVTKGGSLTKRVLQGVVSIEGANVWRGVSGSDLRRGGYESARSRVCQLGDGGNCFYFHSYT